MKVKCGWWSLCLVSERGGYMIVNIDIAGISMLKWRFICCKGSENGYITMDDDGLIPH